ncbi:MAG: hypothetical protein HGA85_00455, partial [Nanoarchaeota archaeon]|nr:hypothetical protein [Nanoarchaeota archaeon]
TTVPQVQDGRNYTFYVLCMNPAGLYSKVSTVSFGVNTAIANRIIEMSPTGYVKLDKANITVVTNKDAMCRYKEEDILQNFPQGFAKNHYFNKDPLMQQAYSYDIICIFNDAETVSGTLAFVVDKTAHTTPEVKAPAEQCDATSLKVNFSSTDATSGISQYYWRVSRSNNDTLLNGSTNQTELTVSIALTHGDIYEWQIIPKDNTGNVGPGKTAITKILLENDLKCRFNALPVLNKSVSLTEKGAKLKTQCSDDSSCLTYYSYLITPSSLCTCNSCKLVVNPTLALEIDITENSTLCYNVTDNDHISNMQNFSVLFESCTGSGCCNGKKAKICSPDCEPITDISCDMGAIDTDLDTIFDMNETACGLNPQNQSDALADFDQDGLSNKLECIQWGTNLTNNDTDGDGYTDKKEADQGTNPRDKSSVPAPVVDPSLDTDGDGIKDKAEKSCGTKTDVKDADEDPDDDGLTNKEECTEGTDINNPDTDGDGYTDKAELDQGTSPTDGEEKPKNNTLSIILFVVGFALVGGGGFLFVKNQPPSQPKQPKPGGAKEEHKPFIDFKYTKKELGSQQQQQQQQQQYAYQPQYSDRPYRRTEARPESSPEDIDEEIRKKKEHLRVKKMTSVFDEFSGETEQKMPPAQPKPKPEAPKKDEEVFEKLDRIDQEDAFDELERLSRGKRK